MSRKIFLLGATALLSATAGLAGGVCAQVTTQIYDGGNTLFAPFLRQSEDCYGNPTPLVIQGANTHSPTTVSITPFNYTGSPPFNCATTHVDSTVQLNTIETGSGTNIKAVFSHDATTFWGDTVPPGSNNTPYPAVHFGTSETPLGASDVTVYNSGGVEQGVTFSLSPQAGQYPIPQPLYGNLIQYPMIIAPLAIAYDSTYKRVRQGNGSVVSYHFHIHRPNKDGSGGLVLDAATYCAIFNGQITDWNQIPTSLNGNVSLKDPADHSTFSVPLTIVGRTDSAGATSTWTRHLAAICPNVISGNQYADAATTLPTPLQGPAWTSTNPNYGPGSGVTDVPGKYTRATGAQGVAAYIQFDPNNLPGSQAGASVVQGRIGYDGTDETLPAVTNTGQNSFGLNQADILRVPGKLAIEPNGKTAALAYNQNILPPTGANRSQQALWVQPASKTAPVAIPSNTLAYPIVGTSNFLGYTCYASAGVATNLVKYLDWFEANTLLTNPTLGLIVAGGSSPMPTAWRTAIIQTFLKPVAATKSLNLYILTAGTGPVSGTGSQCKAIAPGA
jgi:ABC-type phosphate transport system substrate-binding protein